MYKHNKFSKFFVSENNYNSFHLMEKFPFDGY